MASQWLARVLFGGPTIKKTAAKLNSRQRFFECLEDRLAPATLTWNLNGNGSWGTETNWSPIAVPSNGDTLIFGNVITANRTLNNNTAAGNSYTLQFTNSNANYNINGNSIVLSGAGISSLGPVTNTVNNLLVTNQSTPIQVADANGQLTFGGSITGAGGLNQTGLGILNLRGNNGYFGGTTISSAVTTNNGTALGAGSVTINSGASLSFQFATSFNVNNNIGGAGSVVKSEQGTATLLGGNSYSGGTQILAGAVQVGNGGAGGSIVGDVQNNGTLTFSRAGTIAFAGSISGNGAVSILGNGTVTLQGNNSFRGAVNVIAGTLVVGSNTALGTGEGGVVVSDGAALALANIAGGISLPAIQSMTLFGSGPSGGGALVSFGGSNFINGGIALGGALEVIGVDAGTLTIVGSISEFSTPSSPASLTKLGLGTLTLQGSNTHTAGTTVGAGVLIVANDNALGSTAVGTNNQATVSTGATLAISGGHAIPNAAIVLNGTGAPGQLGALVGLGDEAAIGAQSTISTPQQFQGANQISIASASGNFQVAAALSLQFATLTINGTGNTILSGSVTSAVATTTLIGLTVGQSNVANDFAASATPNAAYGTAFDLTTTMGNRAGSGGQILPTDQQSWGTDNTWFYQGQIFVANTNSDGTTGTIAFAEQFDDAVIVRIDGVTYLNDSTPNVASSTGPVTLAAGWHNIDIRFSNDDGGAGPSGAGVGWSTAYGFGYRVCTDPNDPLGSSLNGADYAIPTDNGTGNLFRSGPVAAGITKAGSGTLTLAGANSYVGATAVSAGTLIVANSEALGPSNGGNIALDTTVAAGATLGFQGDITVVENITIAGAGVNGEGALRNVSGSNTFMGSVTAPTVRQSVTLQNAAASYSQSGSPVGNAVDNDPFGTGWSNVGGAGAVTAVFESAANLNPAGQVAPYTFTITSGGSGSQTLGHFRISATTANRNTFANGQPNNGQLGTDWTILFPTAITSDTTTNFAFLPDGSILAFSTPATLVSTYTLTLNSSLANITGFRLETIPDESLPGGGPGNGANGAFIVSNFAVTTAYTAAAVVGSSAGTLSLAGDLFNAAPWQFTVTGAGEVDLNGKFSSDNVSFTKTGDGLVKVNGFNDHTGTLNLQGGTVGGRGKIFDLNVEAGANISPGASPGKFGSDNFNITTGASFDVDLNGTVVDTLYDQLDVNGTVNLDYNTMGGASLNVSVGYIPTNGDTYTILNNDGNDSIIGKFFGLAEGATFVAGGYTFQITYQGGANSNDVVLTAVVSGTLSLSPSTVPAGTVALAYSQSIVASGGTGPYSYAISAGSLPSGLSLSPSGAITGTPDTTGPYTFSVTATDSLAATGSQGYTIYVAPTSTGTTLVATPLATTGGTSVMLTATVSPSPGVSGTVTFNDNGSPIPGGSNIAVVGGVAVFSTSIFTIGSHPVTADFSGTASFLASSSNTENVVVSGAVTTTVLIDLGPNASLVSDNVNFTATVSGGVATDGETIEIQDASNGNVVVATGTLSGGSASLTIPGGTLALGSHNLFAVYMGNTYNAASTSTPATVQVVTTAPQVVSFNVNSNLPAFAGSQRSRVISLVVTFNQAVQLDAGAMTIAPHTGGVFYFSVAYPSGYGSVPASLNLSSTDNITWIMTFAGGTDDGIDLFKSIRDGVYNLNIAANKVHPVGGPTINMASNVQKVFYRLYGDSDAVNGGTPGPHSTSLNSADALILRNAFNSPANYLAPIDFDGDHQVNTTDNLEFRNRFNKPLSWTV